MGTTILAWLIAILGLLMIAVGVWDVAGLWNQRRQTVIPLREWGIAIGLICGGFGMFGIAQALRLLRVLFAVGVGGLSSGPDGWPPQQHISGVQLTQGNRHQATCPACSRD
jgi:hypothetical protein